MYYTANIYDPVQGIDQILVAASKFNAERFLYAIEFKNWDEKKMELMGNEVATYRRKLEEEYNRLVEFAKVFNKEFATMNNKCYSSALTMLRKLRSGISETKKLFTKFCPRARQEIVYQEIMNKPVSAYEYAYISAENYQLPLFKFEGYPACVSGLFNEMEKFFLLLMRCIQLCKEVLNEEKKIKSNNKYCKYLFEEFKNKILYEIADIIMMIPRNSEYLSEKTILLLPVEINTKTMRHGRLWDFIITPRQKLSNSSSNRYLTKKKVVISPKQKSSCLEMMKRKCTSIDTSSDILTN